MDVDATKRLHWLAATVLKSPVTVSDTVLPARRYMC